MRVIGYKLRFVRTILLVLNIVFMYGCTNMNNINTYFDNITTSLSFEYQAPQVIKSTKKTEHLSIEYNADIYIPSNIKPSIFQVFKRSFSSSDYLEIMDYFEPGGEWYAQDKRTTDELSRILVWLQNQPNFRDEDCTVYLNNIKEAIANSDNTLPKKFIFETIKSGDPFIAYCRNNDHYSAIKGQLGGNSFTYMRNADAVVLREGNLEQNDPYKKFFIHYPDNTCSNAQALADEILAKFGMENEYSLRLVERAVGIINNFSIANGWSFLYTRHSSGLNSEYIDNYDIWENSEMPKLVSPWGQEYILVFIDADGVFCFSVHGAGTQGKCIAENVVLENFTLLTKKIEQQLDKQHTPIDPRIKDSSVIINRIELCSALVSEDSVNTGMMIPAWVVHYTLSYSLNGTVVEDNLYTFFNAIDGNYIEPRISIYEIKQLLKLLED